MSEKIRTIAVITARGGSKRIPGKNIREFCGKPIITYTIQAALSAGIFEEVMVSTDDEKIAEIAGEAGAAVPFFRSADTANDYANTTDVMLEVLEAYRKLGKEFDVACCLYPTAPFVTAKKLTDAFKIMQDKQAESLLPVVHYSFPPQRSVVKCGDYLSFKWPEHMFTRSQDLEPFYHDAGQFYFIRVKDFLEQKRLIMTKTVPFELPDLEVQDIDTEEDWEIAEVKYRVMQKKAAKAAE